MQDNLQELINYRIEQSKRTIEEVNLPIKQGLFTIAINRIYYGIFYMLLALSLKEGFKTSKHLQLQGWFNKEFIKSQKIDREVGKIVYRAYEDRTDGDYGVFVEFSKDEVQKKFNDMKLAIKKLEKLIRE